MLCLACVVPRAVQRFPSNDRWVVAYAATSNAAAIPGSMAGKLGNAGNTVQAASAAFESFGSETGNAKTIVPFVSSSPITSAGSGRSRKAQGDCLLAISECPHAVIPRKRNTCQIGPRLFRQTTVARRESSSEGQENMILAAMVRIIPPGNSACWPLLKVTQIGLGLSTLPQEPNSSPRPGR
jgi:hypothetical protein